MSTQPSFDDGVDDIDLTAAEYVLGVLDANARRLALERIEREPAFAAEVMRWESWFSPWLQSIAPGRAAGIDLAAGARRAVATRTSRT